MDDHDDLLIRSMWDVWSRTNEMASVLAQVREHDRAGVTAARPKLAGDAADLELAIFNAVHPHCDNDDESAAHCTADVMRVLAAHLAAAREKGREEAMQAATTAVIRLHDCWAMDRDERFHANLVCNGIRHAIESLAKERK